MCGINSIEKVNFGSLDYVLDIITYFENTLMQYRVFLVTNHHIFLT